MLDSLCHNVAAEPAIFIGKQIHDTFQVPFNPSHEFVVFFFPDFKTTYVKSIITMQSNTIVTLGGFPLMCNV